MVSIHKKAHIGPDGTLNLQVPTEFRETDVEVLVVLNPIQALPQATPAEGPDWPAGYFETTFGCCRDEPLARPPQGKPEEREALL